MIWNLIVVFVLATRGKKGLRALREHSYKHARSLGDLIAFLSGPKHYIKRRLRKTALRWLLS